MVFNDYNVNVQRQISRKKEDINLYNNRISGIIRYTINSIHSQVTVLVVKISILSIKMSDDVRFTKTIKEFTVPEKSKFS